MSPTQPLSQPRREAWWRRMSRRMDRASLSFSEQVRDAVLLRRDLDDSFWDDLLQVLVGADCGLPVAERLVDRLRTRVREERMTSPEEAIRALKGEMLAVLEARDRRLRIESVPAVVIMVGVNGSGKTTTIGKLAHRLEIEGRTVLIAAADTFRAAAIDQMRLWADRTNAAFVAHQPGGDPGAVVYDALQSAVARSIDCVLVDTAGRLHTKVNLMAELIKVRNVARRVLPEAPHEILLVIEAPTGMNAIAQARVFHEALGLTGIVLTKLDGTAKGGIVVAIARELNLPIRFVGTGEQIDDLVPFDAQTYVNSLFD